MDLAAAIAGVSAQFDTSSSGTSDTVIRSWIHAALQDAVARAKWRKAIRAPAIAGASIAVADDVVDVLALRTVATVGAVKSLPWLRCSTEQFWRFEAGQAFITPPGSAPGVFAPYFNSTSVERVEVFEAPTFAGTWEMLCAILPDAITPATATNTVLGVPEDLARPICVDGAVALGRLDAFGDRDGAVSYAERFEAAVAALTRRANGRVGNGPIRMRPGR